MEHVLAVCEVCSDNAIIISSPELCIGISVSKSNHPIQNPLLFVTERRTRDNTKTPHSPHICVFRVVLTINSHCFPKQHQPPGHCSGEVMCFL
jgi:hypothetical protein